jgi:two-component system sensor histidine kinase PilS (NtrC family)
MQLLSQFLVAVLSGYVGEQLSRAGGRLVASERDLQSLTNLQNEIVSAIPSGLITCGSDGVVTFVNTAGSTILGVDPSAVVGVRAVDALLPSARAQPVGRRWETRVETSRGERTLGLSMAPLTTGGLLIVFQDLTELRQVEAELDRIDHLATLGRLSAQLAHEIRNPLAAMRGSAQLLSGDVAGGPQARLAGVIMREADRLARLVDGYLKLARPPPPQLIQCRLDQVVLETMELLRADPSFVTIRIEQQLEPIEALCDPSQVKQALLNLLRNAAAAVSAARGLIRVRVRAHDGVPSIDVWDSAGSVRAEDRHRIFEPFFTRVQGGTGLGLSTVQTIAQAHGGSISVESSPEQGTTFSFTLRSSGEPHVAHSGRR